MLFKEKLNLYKKDDLKAFADDGVVEERRIRIAFRDDVDGQSLQRMRRLFVGANADDAAGVMRASASNESVTVVMPFAPFAPGTPEIHLQYCRSIKG